MRVNPQEALTESNKESDVEQSVGRKIMELKTIDEKEASKKFMRREGETAQEKCKENNRPSRFRNGSYLLARELDLGVPQEAIATENADVGRGERRFPPSS